MSRIGAKGKTPGSAGSGTLPQTENLKGSDANGSDGGSNRVFTLANTSTSSEEQVHLNGVVQTLTEDYTVSHLGVSSTITMIGALFDADFVTVRFFI